MLERDPPDPLLEGRLYLFLDRGGQAFGSGIQREAVHPAKMQNERFGLRVGGNDFMFFKKLSGLL